jgi:hypothetical protein
VADSTRWSRRYASFLVSLPAAKLAQVLEAVLETILEAAQGTHLGQVSADLDQGLGNGRTEAGEDATGA